MERHERIAHAIAASGKKKGEIAAECGVANSAVTQWINGSSKSLKPENLYALAKATGFRPEWLAIGEGEPHQPATSPAPAGQGQAEPDRGAAEVVHHAGMLAMAATPRSREILRRIAMAADEGRLTEDDLNLLDQIAARFESRQADPTTTPAAPHQRLREKLKRND